MTEFANVWPTKRFFLEMLVRDITLEDAILDLVDNSIDSLARTQQIPLSEELLNPKSVAKHSARLRKGGLPQIDVRINKDTFSITDNCGGIEYEVAKNYVFRLGRVAEQDKSRLSVYGIGLKRAIFKIGRSIHIRSQAHRDGFESKIDVDRWAQSDESETINPQDWRFPIEKISGSKSLRGSGTTISISSLHKNIQARISDGQLESRLHDVISRAYALILDHFVILRINGARVRPQQIPIGLSGKVTSATERFDVSGTTVTIVAGLAERTEWKLERAGWYVLCNGRVVVFADKGELTGWGYGAPQFVPKYRGFTGIAFFFSSDPESLPWTTTKRGLNQESQAYLVARNKMGVMAKPVLSFLNKMYPGDAEAEEPEERAIADTVKRADIAAVIKASRRVFSVKTSPAKKGTTYVSIQFKVKQDELEKARSAAKKPKWSASKIGLHAFEYFLQKEYAN